MKNFNKFILASLLCFLSMFGLTGCFGKDEPDTINNNTYNVTSAEAMTIIAEQSLPSCVTLTVTDRNGNGSLGSGVCISAGSYIATNYHVVEYIVRRPSTYTLSVYHNDMIVNREIPHTGKVLWFNKETDTAIVKCSCDNLPALKMEDRTILPEGNRQLRIVEDVLSIGTPLDTSLQNTVAKGNVSQLNRLAVSEYSESGTNYYENLIQHTAAISGGNSGGPLIDREGKVIGLNTLSLADSHSINGSVIESSDANSIYFATPILPVIKAIDNVKSTYEKSGKSFTAGNVGITGADKYLNSNYKINGFFISGIDVNGASYGKLTTSDIITGVTVDEVLYNVNNRNDFLYATMGLEQNKSIKITFKRNGLSEQTTNIILK